MYALLLPALLVLALGSYFFLHIYQLKRKFKKMGVRLSLQQAINILLRGGYRVNVAEATKLAGVNKLDVSVENLQLHAVSGGNPLEVVEAHIYILKKARSVPSLKVGFKQLCLIDLSSKNLKQAIEEAEKLSKIQINGELEFSGFTYRYDLMATYRRPLMSVAFDTFTGKEIDRELKRKIEDVRRYHKELIRVSAGDANGLRKHLLHTVLRPEFWERNFRLLLHEQELKLQKQELEY
ncbi:MAG: hypothetical protein LAT67_02415 [Balneolales bacterium]|nr:hypothetical protein [Balneolales bacterium]